MDRELQSVSIIIVTHNSANDLLNCIDSVVKYTSLPFEIIVVDNNSSDLTRDIIDEYIKRSAFRIIKIENRENLGFSKACSQGLQIARGKYVVLLNPDTVVTPDWVRNLISHFREDIGAIGPISNNAAGLQNLQRYLPEIDPKAGSLPLPKLSKLIHDQFKGQSIETKLLIGFCLILPTELLRQTDGLNERLFLNDGLNLSWRLRREGYRLLVAKDVFIYHKGLVSFYTKPFHESQRFVRENTDSLAEELVNYYGWGNVPLPEDLWGINWFRPSKKYIGIFKNPDKKVSIIVLNYKHPHDTIECLDSIYKSTYSRFQTIVIDNGSDDESIDMISSWAKKNIRKFYSLKKKGTYEIPQFSKELILINSDENLGYTGGNNLGLKEALRNKADYIWFLNNDTVVEEDALLELVRIGEADKRIGLVCSKLYVYDHPEMVQYNGKRAAYDGFEDDPKDYPQPALRATGCSLLTKKEVIETSGFWDEDYFLYFDDDDFALRSYKNGWSIYYTPYSKVYHKGAVSTGGWLNNPVCIYYFTRNLLLFYLKHYRDKLDEGFQKIYSLGYKFLDETEKLLALAKGVEDFLERRWGKASINFDRLHKDLSPLNTKYKQKKNRPKSAQNGFQKALITLLHRPSSPALAKLLTSAKEVSESNFPFDNSEIDRRIQKAEYLYEQGKIQKCTKELSKIIEIEPSCAKAHSNLATIYWEKGEFEKALDHITRAIEIDPHDRDAIWNAVQILLQLGLTEEARKMCARYIYENIDDPEIKALVELVNHS